jgi:flagellar biosynthetic protein FliP
MTAPMAARKAALADGRFWRHLVEMLLAMVVGMVVLGPLWPELHGSTELHLLVMATDMTLGMTLWMAVRRHRWAPIAEMGLAMYVPFVVLLPLFWTGRLSADAVFVLGHVLMLPAMVLAMLRRPSEYLCQPLWCRGDEVALPASGAPAAPPPPCDSPGCGCPAGHCTWTPDPGKEPRFRDTRSARPAR